MEEDTKIPIWKDRDNPAPLIEPEKPKKGKKEKEGKEGLGSS